MGDTHWHEQKGKGLTRMQQYPAYSDNKSWHSWFANRCTWVPLICIFLWVGTRNREPIIFVAGRMMCTSIKPELVDSQWSTRSSTQMHKFTECEIINYWSSKPWRKSTDRFILAVDHDLRIKSYMSQGGRIRARRNLNVGTIMCPKEYSRKPDLWVRRYLENWFHCLTMGALQDGETDLCEISK